MKNLNMLALIALILAFCSCSQEQGQHWMCRRLGATFKKDRF